MSLPTETNTPEMHDRVLAAARYARLGDWDRLSADFEHGRWWVTDLDSGAQWAAVDCERVKPYGFGRVQYIDFEQVTEPSE